MLYYIILCYIILYYVMLYYIILYYDILCYIMLYYIILCYIILYYVIYILPTPTLPKLIVVLPPLEVTSSEGLTAVAVISR